MPVLTLDFDTDNDAFDLDASRGIVGLLRDLADRMDRTGDLPTIGSTGTDWKLMDVNGNTIGSASLSA